MSCKPYLDTNGFFENVIHKAEDMLNVCDQSKILNINFFDKTKPGNLYAVNSTNNMNLDYALVPGVEGFISGGPPGEKNTQGYCPDGHSFTNGKCQEVCTSCKYSDRTHGKSTVFNEYDTCFSEGVFNGYDNNGIRNCTCGKNNKYCSHSFLDKLYTTDGMFYNDNELIINIANANDMENFALFK